MGSCFDQKFEPWINVNEELKVMLEVELNHLFRTQKLNTVLDSLMEKLTHTLTKPVDIQLEEFNAVKPNIEAWRNNVYGLTHNALVDETDRFMYKSEPKLTHFGTSPNTHATEKLDKSLASELRTLNQKSPIVCCEVWQNLLEAFLNENVSFSHLLQSQKHQLVKLQSRLNQNLSEEKILNNLPNPGRTQSPVQAKGNLKGIRLTVAGQTSASVDLNTRPRTDKPTRPLRAREKDAIKQLSCSSQDVTLNKFTDLFATDSSGDSIELVKSTDELNNVRKRSYRHLWTEDNWSDSHSASNAESPPVKPRLALEFSKRLEQHLPRTNAQDIHRNRVAVGQRRFCNKVNEANEVRVINAPPIKRREVILREPVGRSKGSPKGAAQIIIQKQLPSSNGYPLAWNRTVDIRAASTEHFQPNHKSPPRLTIIEQPYSSLESIRGTSFININQPQKQKSTQNLHRTSDDSNGKPFEVHLLQSFIDLRSSFFQFVATHPYAAQDIDELSLRLNEVVRMLPWPESMENVSVSINLEVGWLYGERVRDGVRGIFPVNFTNCR
ncbi:hypothetical protein FBUS_04284 [Fasciolopsis buskii]|uniref:SH3 domain-containing protein n=1 Tax=Fasciolopsis buskii TaxID=27845 RepID=A0A8E0VF44_9TREM|nr:hypothetical protein FBUS_04284 [Fasciolopsis buski]